MNRLKHLTILFLFIFINFSVSFSQEDTIQIEDLFELSLEELMQIEVFTASKTSQSIENAPAIISVITEQDIKQQGFKNLGEALQSIAGVFVSTDHVTHNVSVRGINGGRNASSRTLKIMIDGQSIDFRSTSESFIGSELIPLSMVERIEIIKGPASTLYGANAFLGVINVITKKAEDENSTFFVYENGLNSTGHFEFSTFQSYGDINFSLGFSTEKVDRGGLYLQHSTDILKERVNKEYDAYQPFLQKTKHDISEPIVLYSKLDWETSLGKFSTYSYYQALNNDGRFYDKNPVLNETKINIANYFIKEIYQNSFFDENLNLNISSTYAKGKVLDDDIIDYHPSTSDGFKIKRDMGYESIDLSGEINYTFLDNFNVLLGADYTYDEHDLLSYSKINKIDNQVSKKVETIGETNFNNMGVFFQGMWDISEKGSLTAGLRYDEHSVYGNDFNYRFAGIYHLTEKLYTKALYGTSFRAPTPDQLFSPNPPYNFSNGIIGNENLKPEEAETYEILLGIKPTENMDIQFTGFMNNIENVIVIQSNAGMSSPVNQNSIQSIGGEMAFNWKWEKLSGNINLSYQHSYIEIENKDEQETPLFPNILVNGKVNYNFNHFNLCLKSYFVDDYLASQSNIHNNLVFGRENDYRISEYYLFDLTILSKNIYSIGKKEKLGSIANKMRYDKQLLLSFSIKNIFDKKFSYGGFYNYDIPALGRSVSFGITINI